MHLKNKKRQSFAQFLQMISVGYYQAIAQRKSPLKAVRLDKVSRSYRGNTACITFHITINDREFLYQIRRVYRRSIHIRCRKESECRAGLSSG